MVAPYVLSRKQRASPVVPWLVALLGAIASALLWTSARDRVAADQAEVMENAAYRARALLTERIEASRQRLTSCRAFFAGSVHVDADELASFLRELDGTRFAGSERLIWLPGPHARSRDDLFVPQQFNAPAYTPQPYAGAQRLAGSMGLTLARAEETRAAVLHVATEPYQRPPDLPIAVLVEPIHRPKAGASGESELVGWILEPLEIASVLQSLQQRLGAPLTLNLVFDGSAPPPDSNAGRRSAWRSYTMHLAGRPARLDIQPSPNWHPDFASRFLPHLVFAGGIALSFLVAVLLGSLRSVSRRARELAVQTNRSMHSVTAGVPGVVFRLHRSPGGRLSFEFVSEAVHGILGTTSSACVADPLVFFQSMDGKDCAAALAALEHSARTLEPWTADVCVRRANGSRGWLRISALTQRSSDLGATWNGIALDATQTREAERSAADLATILEESSVEVYIVDAASLRLLQVNRHAAANLGFEAHELVGLRPHQIELNGSLERLRASLEPLREGRLATLEIRTRLLRKDGTQYPVEIQLQRSRLRGADVFVAMVIDVTRRRAAEQALAASQERLDFAVRGSSDGLWDWYDIAGDCVWWSPRLLALLQREDMPIEGGMGALQALLHPDDAETCRRAIDEHRDHGRAFDVELRVQMPSDCLRWFRMRGDSTRNSAGHMVRLAGSLTDVDDRRAAEDALRASEQRLVMSLAAAGIGCWDLALADGQLEGDQRVARMLGVDGLHVAEGVRGLLRLVHPADRARVTADLERHLKGGPPFATEFRVVTADGSVRFVGARGQCQNAPNGRRERMLGVLWDVTERRLHDAQLRRSAEMLEELQRISGVGGWELDLVSGELHWTDEVRRIHEVPSDFRPSLDAAIDFYSPSSVPPLREALRRAIENEEPFDLELEIVSAKGTHRWVRTQGRASAVEGIVARVDGTFQDVSARKLAEIEMLRARDLAEAASRAKSEFLANMSHEIRTPMTAILGYAELLLESDVDEGTRLEHVRTIMRNGDHLLAILNDILDLSKIEAGKFCVLPEACDLAVLVNEVATLMRVRADAKGLNFALELHAGLPRLFTTDAVRLRQILMNLLGNAIKFTEHGEVRLVVLTHAGPHGPEVRFEVVDSGIGIGATEIKRLFQPFDQADASAARRFGGTGLGLAISRRLARMLGGDIVVESVPGSGSIFRLSLPVAEVGLSGTRVRRRPDLEAPRWVEGPAAAVPARPLTGVRVLLAEDGLDNQRLVSHHLRRAGAEVTVVDDGRAAVDCLNRVRATDNEFHVVLMDMQMPVLDGYGATRELRAAGERSPIIAFTAHAMAGDKERCFEAGCDDFETKPVQGKQLVARVGHWAGRASTWSAPGSPTLPLT